LRGSELWSKKKGWDARAGFCIKRAGQTGGPHVRKKNLDRKLKKVNWDRTDVQKEEGSVAPAHQKKTSRGKAGAGDEMEKEGIGRTSRT